MTQQIASEAVDFLEQYLFEQTALVILSAVASGNLGLIFDQTGVYQTTAKRSKVTGKLYWNVSEFLATRAYVGSDQYIDINDKLLYDSTFSRSNCYK